MLNNRQKKLLTLLDDKIENCKQCKLYENGKCLPYWTPISEYVIIGEAPGRDEVENNEPFVGRAGRILWGIFSEFGFRKEQFAIINSVNCRPVTSRGTNGKPTPLQQGSCYPWIRKFIKIINNEKILVLGSYAKRTLTGTPHGIKKINATREYNYVFDGYMFFSVHPALSLYDQNEGKKLLREAIKNFKGDSNV